VVTPKRITIDKPFTIFSTEADKDYLLARMVSFLGGGFHSRAGYFGHQACEKYLKALSVQRDGTYAETHKLLDLAGICAPFYEFLGHELATKDLKLFDVFEQVGRYGAAATFDPLSRGKPLEGLQFYPSEELQIAGAAIWTEDHLRRLDRFVYNARGYLDFGKADYDDSFVSILLDNQRSMMVSLWRGPIPLKEVLTRQNAYFTPEALRHNR